MARGFTSLMLFFYCGAASFLRVASALGAYSGGVIVEYSADVPRSPNEDHPLVAHVRRSLNDAVLLSPRLQMRSPLFTGDSFSVAHTDGTVSQAALHAALLQHPHVVAVWPNAKRTLKLPTLEPLHGFSAPLSGRDADILQARQAVQTFGDGSPLANPHRQTGVDRLHAANLTGRGVKIALLDTGIDPYHPVFGSGYGTGFKVVAGYDFSGEDPGYNVFTPDPSPITNCNNHGTATSSIAAGLQGKFGFVGVAPGAQLEMYKLFKCLGAATEVTTDIAVNASLTAYHSGADIISVAISSPGGFGNDPWGIVAKRIIDNGCLYLISAANDGEMGPFFANGLSSTMGVPSIGSTDNAYSPTMMTQATYSVDGGTPVPFDYAPGFPANFSDPMELIRIVTNGCIPYPTDVTYQPNQVVLVPRVPYGTVGCNQTGNLADAGIRYVLGYNFFDNNPLRPLPVATNEGFPFDTLNGTGWVDRAIGLRLADLVKSGSNVTLHLPWKPWNDNRYLRLIKNDISGGYMSNYSSWGPTFEMKIQTTVSAPGGFMLAAGTRLYGGYVVASGTSFSVPYVAGIAALVKEMHPNLTAVEILNRIATTAKPLRMQDPKRVTQSFLAPPFQQGAGAVDAYAAVYATTTVNVTDLPFNDTAANPTTLAFRITNTGADAVQYSLQHDPAATVFTFLPGQQAVTKFNSSDFIETSVRADAAALANLTFSPDAPFTVAAGASADVAVTVSPPQGLDAARVPLYSGFVRVVGSNGDVLTVPYGGAAAALRDVPVQDTSPTQNDTALISGTAAGVNGSDQAALQALDYLGSMNNTFVVPKADRVDAIANTTLPGFFAAFNFGCLLLKASLLRDNGESNVSSMADLGLVSFYMGDQPIPFFARYYRYPALFHGRMADGSFAPNGTYRFRVSMLRVRGDPTNDKDFDTVVTGNFTLNLVG